MDNKIDEYFVLQNSFSSELCVESCILVGLLDLRASTAERRVFIRIQENSKDLAETISKGHSNDYHLLRIILGYLSRLALPICE